MYDLSVAHINSHMSTVTDQISRLCICVGYFCTCILLFIGSSRKAYTKVGIYTLYKTGAVCTVGKACSAPYIRISDKLCGIIYNGRTGTTVGRRTSAVRRGILRSIAAVIIVCVCIIFCSVCISGLVIGNYISVLIILNVLILIICIIYILCIVLCSIFVRILDYVTLLVILKL